MSLAEDPKDNAVVMRGIAKSFGGVAALENVDFSVRKGEIHALLGGNGAGKIDRSEDAFRRAQAR